MSDDALLFVCIFCIVAELWLWTEACGLWLTLDECLDPVAARRAMFSRAAGALGFWCAGGAVALL